MQNLGNRRSVQKCAQNAGSNVLKLIQSCFIHFEIIIYAEKMNKIHVILNTSDEILAMETELFLLCWKQGNNDFVFETITDTYRNTLVIRFFRTSLFMRVKTKPTRNTLTQASKNGRKPYLFPQKKFVSVLCNKHIIYNTIYYFKPTNSNCAQRKCLL